MSRTTLRLGMLAAIAACAALALASAYAVARPGAGGGNKTGTLQGVVTFDDGSAAAGATVRLFRSGAGDIDYFAETFTSSDGSYRFRRLPPDTYSVSATFLTPGFGCFGNTTATVVARQTTTVNVTLGCN